MEAAAEGGSGGGGLVEPGRPENGQGEGGKSLNFQHEELKGRVVGEKEDGCGMGDQPGPLPLVRTHSPSPSIIYSK